MLCTFCGYNYVNYHFIFLLYLVVYMEAVSQNVDVVKITIFTAFF